MQNVNNHKYQFQFHKGTIRTYEKGRAEVGQYIFQFHKGTIRT